MFSPRALAVFFQIKVANQITQAMSITATKNNKPIVLKISIFMLLSVTEMKGYRKGVVTAKSLCREKWQKTARKIHFSVIGF